MAPNPAIPEVVDPATNKPCTTTQFTPTRVWRISDDQYVAAVNDLLPGVKAPDVTTPGRAKAEFVDFAELLPVNSAVTTDIRNSAEKSAQQAVADLPKLLACVPGQTPDACADAFIQRFGARAFRRPLEPVEKQELKALYTSGAMESPAKGMEMVISAILQAPSFIYRAELGRAAVAEAGKPVELTPYEVASSLSFLLLDSVPDAELWKAAEDGSIVRPEVLERQVQRLMTLPRVQENLARIHIKWVGLGDGVSAELAEKHKEFTPELKASMEQETALFFKSLLTKGGTLADVLTSNKGFADQRLATHYGLTGTRPAGFSEVSYPAEQRAGVLTQAAVLSRYSITHPVVLRGKYVRDELLCGEIPSPPNIPDVDNENMASANLPEREQVERRLKHATCGGCHALMDPIGLAFMNYDGLARFRTTEAGRPIDSRGTLSGTEDADGPVMNAVDLAQKLARSKTVRACVTEKMFSYAFGRMSAPFDKCELQRIDALVQAKGGKLAELMAAVVYSAGFRYRTSTGGK